MLYKSLTLALVAKSLASAPVGPEATCRDLKSAYQTSSCCGANLETTTDFVVEPSPPPPMAGPNPCAGARPYYANTPGFPDTPSPYFNNANCTLESGVVAVLEQAGANVTVGYVGSMASPSGGTPIQTPYWQNGMCPVNVHWHLGTEHLSVGEYDEHGTGPAYAGPTIHTDPVTPLGGGRRMSASPVRRGYQCHHYDAADPQFTTPYDWKYCTDMVVGETYEVHWPHSAAGACGTPNQYQSPFYDGVFCMPGIITLNPVNTFSTIGVQGQVFTIVNNESYYYPDMMRGMIVDGEMGQHITKYTGSTTGTTRDNTVCSRYTPITWQVDRKCHLISASSFDKMCKDMLAQRDDMSMDVHAHGSRMLVSDELAATNQVYRQRE